MFNAIINLIRRTTPEIADCFDFETVENSNEEIYGYSKNGNKIVLKGSNTVCLALAYKKYITEYCLFSEDFCGNNGRKITDAPIPENNFEKKIVQKYRVFGDYTFYSNDAWKWDFSQWEKELDRLAMNGINMAVNLVGNEAVCFYTLVKMDFSVNDAMQFISGPSFYAWQMTNKITEYIPRTNPADFDKSIELAKKIYNRMCELGITPIMSTFSGIVPRTVVALFGGTNVSIKEKWASFPKTYRFNIENPNFRRFYLKYLELQEEYIGKSNFYLCNQLCNSNLPSKKKEIALFEERANLLDKMSSFYDDSAVLVFTSEGYCKEFMNKIKLCDTLILDIDGKMCRETDLFDGCKFILGNSHNNNSHNSMQGDITFVANNPYAEIKKECDNIIGTGLFPQSLEQNPLYFELSFDMLTKDEKIDLNSWYRKYEKRRYLTDAQNSEKRLELLCSTCYSSENSSIPFGSAICTRPALTLRHTAIGDHVGPSYDNKQLEKLFNLFESIDSDNDAYGYDLCNIAKQLLDNYAFIVSEQITQSYRNRNLDIFKMKTKEFLEILSDADTVLSSEKHFNSKTHLDRIAKLADNDEEISYLTINYLAFLTVWGPMREDNKRYDCGWQLLGGLVNEYYRKRWEKFFDQLSGLFGFIGFQDKSRQQFSGRNAYTFSQFYKDMARFEQGVLLTFNPSTSKDGNIKQICGDTIKKYINKQERLS